MTARGPLQLGKVDVEPTEGSPDTGHPTSEKPTLSLIRLALPVLARPPTGLIPHTPTDYAKLPLLTMTAGLDWNEEEGFQTGDLRTDSLGHDP